MKEKSQILLIITHPFLMAVYAFIYVLFGMDFALYEWSNALLILAYFAIALVILPLITLFLMYKMNVFKSWLMETKEDRIYPLIVMTLFYGITFWMLNDKPLFYMMKMVLVMGFAISIVSLLINFFWKISLHTLGLGSLMGFFFVLSILFMKPLWLPLILIVLVAGFVGMQRLYVKAHNPAQIYVGFIVGFSVSVLVFMLQYVMMLI